MLSAIFIQELSLRKIDENSLLMALHTEDKF